MIDKIENFGLKILERIRLKKLAEWYRKHQEQMRYLIFGALTTVVNILSYAILFYAMHIENAISNVIAWIIGATFAYITNRKYVFKSKAKTKEELLKEAGYFYGCRLLTLAIDQGVMVFTVDKLGWNAILMKILANIVVIILNYIFSKLLIFRKK